MKTTPPLTRSAHLLNGRVHRLLSLTVLTVLAASLWAAQGQGTAFTYQGRLNANGANANGAYDLRFKLFLDALGNTQIGVAVVTNGVAVANGLFTVPLDFGGASFNGSNLWLEVEVKTNGAASYVALSPLQALTPAPYALFAQNAASVTLASGVYTNAVAFNNSSNLFSGSFTGNGAGLSNVNATALGGLGAGAFWQLGGNNVGNGQFLGSTNGQPVEFWVSQSRALRLEPGTNAYAIVGAPNVIGGAPNNVVDPGIVGATIAGGGALNMTGFLPGPSSNRVAAIFGAIGGGRLNTVAADHAMIGGGLSNSVQALAYDSVIAGGYGHVIGTNAVGAVIGGGHNNTVGTNAYEATVSGGLANTAAGYYASVGGGRINGASGSSSTVGGGAYNAASGDFTTIGGGLNNFSTTTYATVGGGNLNSAGGVYGTVGGGYNNFVLAAYATVGGGYMNSARVTSATVGGGFQNTASADSATVGGGVYNSASATGAVVGGGIGNLANAVGAAVSGGVSNNAGFTFALVAGGTNNLASGDGASVGGGYNNQSSGRFATLSGGAGNSSAGLAAAVSGGQNNSAGGTYATVSGGYGNSASGANATVAGGNGNLASGIDSFAAGSGAQALHNGSFVWSDGTSFASTTTNQFAVSAAGGVVLAGDVSISGGQPYHYLSLGGGNSAGFFYGSYPRWGDGVHLGYNYYADSLGGSHIPNPGGGTSRVSAGYNSIVLATGGAGIQPTYQNVVISGTTTTVNGTFVNNSDRNAKMDFTAVSPAQILEKVAQLPLSEWSYKEEPATRHLGPMAQDFYAAFNVGLDERHIAPIDEGGVALAAIQALKQKTDELTAELERRNSENAELKRRLEKLEQLVCRQK